jgi:hypothetical protein
MVGNDAAANRIDKGMSEERNAAFLDRVGFFQVGQPALLWLQLTAELCFVACHGEPCSSGCRWLERNLKPLPTHCVTCLVRRDEHRHAFGVRVVLSL